VAIRESGARLGQQGSRGKTVRQGTRAKGVVVDGQALMGSLGMMVMRGNLASMEKMANPVHQALQAHQAQVAIWGNVGHKVPQETRAGQDRQAHQGNQVLLVQLAREGGLVRQ
jgi:hypothetical protein